MPNLATNPLGNRGNLAEDGARAFGFLTIVVLAGACSTSYQPTAPPTLAETRAFVTKVVRLAFPSEALKLLDTSISLLAILILTGLVLTQVFRKGRITLHRVQGAVAAYLLLTE